MCYIEHLFFEVMSQLFGNHILSNNMIDLIILKLFSVLMGWKSFYYANFMVYVNLSITDN